MKNLKGAYVVEILITKKELLVYGLAAVVVTAVATVAVGQFLGKMAYSLEENFLKRKA